MTFMRGHMTWEEMSCDITEGHMIVRADVIFMEAHNFKLVIIICTSSCLLIGTSLYTKGVVPLSCLTTLIAQMV